MLENSRTPDSAIAAGRTPLSDAPGSTRLLEGRWARSRILPIPVFFAQLAFFWEVAIRRLIDGDEGFYLMASRLVFQHKLPYRDFFFTQTPMLPYVYGLWMQIVGRTWLSARLLSALLTALLGTAIYAYVRRETRKVAPGLFAVVLFASSTLVFGWFTIVKTFALGGLLLFLAFLMLNFSAVVPRIAIAASGVFLGLAADVRLYLGGLVPLFLWWLLRTPQGEKRWSRILWFLAGLLLAVLPNVYFLLQDQDSYLFNTLLFHAMRSGSGMVGGYSQKLNVLLQVLFLGSPGNGLQMTMLVGLVSFLAGRVKVWSAAVTRAIQVAVALAVISLLPTPSYVQYFCLCVPFLIVAGTCAGSQFLDSLSRSSFRMAAAGAIAFAGLFVIASTGDYQKFFITGDGLNGIHGTQRAPNWRLQTVREVTGAIDEIAAAGEPVISLWPGYLIESKAMPFPGLENNTGRERADALSPAQLAKYHIVPQNKIEEALTRYQARLVVIGNQESMLIPAEPYVEMLSRHGYRLVRQIGDTSIWSAPR